jgi:hypothetical protein
MKHCNKCNISKPLSEFNKSKNHKDGLQYECKECNKQYNQDNKESIDEYNKQHYQDNKESINEKNLKLHMSEGYGVYSLTHLPTQCYYIGEGQIHSRRTKHFNKLKGGCNPYGLLQEHYNKHPNIDDWEFEVIRKFEDYDKDAGLEVEKKLIKWGFENVPNKILNKNI